MPGEGGLITFSFSYDRATNQVSGVEVADPRSSSWAKPDPAVGDGFIGISGLLHQSRSDGYRTPFGAVPFDTDVTLRLRTFADDAERVEALVTALADHQHLRRAPSSHDLANVASAGATTSGRPPSPPGPPWRSTPTSSMLQRRRRACSTCCRQPARMAAAGRPSPCRPGHDQGWNIYTYVPGLCQAPDWAKNAVIYQIFPDRFRNGDPANDQTDEDWFYPGSAGPALLYRAVEHHCAGPATL